MKPSQDHRPSPPALFQKLFKWYCEPGLHKSIEGDLIEEYHTTLKESGKAKANLRFAVEVLLLFRPEIIRPIRLQNLRQRGMYKSYLKVGWRSMLRYKAHSMLNIVGLALGMAVAMLNGLCIWDELSHNKYFDNYDRVAQVAELSHDKERGGEWLGTTMTYPLTTELMTNYRDHFKRIARTSFDIESILTAAEMKMSVRGMYADADFPHIFSFKMVSGSRNGLQDPNGILISQSTAKALFGTEEIIDKSLIINNHDHVRVNGVFEDFPMNTRLDGLQFFASYKLYIRNNSWIQDRAINDWRNHFLKLYVELPEPESFISTTAMISSALKFAPEDQSRAVQNDQRLYLYPMSHWHLYPPGLRQGQSSPVVLVRLVAIIGAAVLLLACINFVNLSTARSELRAKEVGVRKAIGSKRSQLIQQFFTESFLIVICAYILALVLTAFFLPTFNEIASKDIRMPWGQIGFWIAGASFIFTTGMLAASWPALVLSSFDPARVLKGKIAIGNNQGLPRKVLVVFQFTISIILIITTAVVYKQIDYVKNRPVGYEREGLIMIRKKSDEFRGKYAIIRNNLLATGVVDEVSESMGAMTEVASGNNGWDWSGRNPDTDNSFATLAVSATHGRTVGWRFLAGRDFNPDLPTDSSSVVITRSAWKEMKLVNPVGEELDWTWWSDKRVMHYKIIGVIEDLVMESPYASAEPTIFFLKGFNGAPNWINIRVAPHASMAKAVPAIQDVFEKVIPSVPFEYKFVDDEYALKFGKEERIARIALTFTVLAIVISCLGLLGLASFVARQRTKEIGIRKILGASVTGIWQMLSKDFVVLVALSSVLASPIAFYLLSQWLQNFEYRTEISWWIFAATAFAAVTIGLMTVSYQAVRAALANPVRSLRSE